jgi:hypothetical protein
MLSVETSMHMAVAHRMTATTGTTNPDSESGAKINKCFSMRLPDSPAA